MDRIEIYVSFVSCTKEWENDLKILTVSYDFIACVYWTITFSRFEKNTKKHQNKPNKIWAAVVFIHNRTIFKISLTMEYFLNIFYIDKKVLDYP